MKRNLGFCTLLLFFSASALAKTVMIPLFAEGVVRDPKAKLQGYSMVYEIEAKLDKQPIAPAYTDNSTVEKLTASIIQSYVADEPEKYKALYTAGGLKKMMEIGEAKFTQLWKLFKPQPDYVLTSYFNYRNGVFGAWGSSARDVIGMFFAVKSGSGWRLENLDVKPGEVDFANILTYVKYRSFDYRKATLLKDFRLSDSELSIVAQVELPMLYVLKKSGNDWEVFATSRDNLVEGARNKDQEPAKGLVKIKLDPNEFVGSDQTELLIMQTNFPIVGLPGGVEAKGQIKL